METYKGWEVEIVDASNSDADRGKLWGARASKQLDGGVVWVRPNGRYVQCDAVRVVQLMKDLIDKVEVPHG